jgi:hypothetical protein
MRNPILVAMLSAALALPAAPALAAESGASGPWREGSPRSDSPRPAAVEQKTEAPMFGRNNIHKYLGLGSIGAAALTIIAPKQKGGAHENFARAAAVLGGAAVATGLYAHFDDLSWDWSNPDTQHATYGALGVLGFLLAVSKGGEGGHAVAGSLGAVAMVTAIKITW